MAAPPRNEPVCHRREELGGHAVPGRLAKSGPASGHEGDDVDRCRRTSDSIEHSGACLEARRPGHRMVSDHESHPLGHLLGMVGHANTSDHVEHGGGAAGHGRGRFPDGDDHGLARTAAGQRGSGEGLRFHRGQTCFEPCQHLGSGLRLGVQDPGVEVDTHLT